MPGCAFLVGDWLIDEMDKVDKAFPPYGGNLSFPRKLLQINYFARKFISSLDIAHNSGENRAFSNSERLPLLQQPCLQIVATVTAVLKSLGLFIGGTGNLC